MNFVLRWSVFGLSPRRPGLDPEPVHVGFVVDKVAIRQVLFQYVGFFLALFDDHCSIRIFIHRLLLPAEQTSENGEPSNPQISFGNLGNVA
jgi:hypothetical protein